MDQNLDLPPKTYVFGPFCLDPSRRRLEKSGAPVALNARAFDILVALVEARDRVVTRGELLSRVWPGIMVDEHNLSVQMSALRRALGESGDQPGMIATVPGRGYRFTGVLEGGIASTTTAKVGEQGVVARSPTARHLAGGAFAGLLLLIVVTALLWDRSRHEEVVAPPLSIVVIPFRALGNDPSEGYLADAVTDDLSTDLARIPGTLLIARQSAEAFSGHSLSAAAIGKELHVRFLVEGSLRKDAGALRIDVRLIDAQSNTMVWARPFNGFLQSLSATQKDIVHSIATALQVEPAKIEKSQATATPQNDPTAFDLFAHARSILDHKDGLGAYNEAEHLLEEAVHRDPNFSGALAELSWMLLYKIHNFDDRDEVADLREARERTGQALAIAPNNALALAAKGRLLVIDGNIEAARAIANTALSIEPGSSEASSVIMLCAEARGDVDAIIDVLEAVIRADPASHKAKGRYEYFAEMRLLQGNYAAALELIKRATENDPEPSAATDSLGREEWCSLMRIASLKLLGDSAAARDAYAAYTRIWPNRTVWRVASYYAASLRALPSFKPFMMALHQAGMPLKADEYSETHVAATASALPVGDFTPTPSQCPVAAVISTADLKRLLATQPKPLIVDVGRGAAPIPGARLSGQIIGDASPAILLAATEAEFASAAGAPVVVAGDGTYGSDSYNAVLQLASVTHRKIFWYRGGEEAWSGGTLP